MLACHGRGRKFECRRPSHFLSLATPTNRRIIPGSIVVYCPLRAGDLKTFGVLPFANSLSLLLGAALHEDACKGLPVPPRQDRPKKGDNEREGQSGQIQKYVIAQNVHEHRAENGKRQWDVAVYQKKRAADHLHRGDHEDVVRLDQRVKVLARQSGRQWCVNEIQKSIQTKDKEDKA